MPRVSDKSECESYRKHTNVVLEQMVTVREAEGITHPGQLRHLWHLLWPRTPRASFRQTPESLEATSFGSRSGTQVDDGRWRFLIVSAWQCPIGIVSFREQTIRRAFASRRVLSAPDSPWGYLPSAVGPHPATTFAAAVRHLLDNDESWDVLEIPELFRKGDESRVTHEFRTDRAEIRNSQRVALGLELPASFGQFWADRDSAARQRWRELEAQRSLRRNEQFIRFRPRGALHGDTDREWPFLRQIERIVQSQNGTPHANRSRELFDRLRETHAMAVDTGCADIAVWLSNSRPAAFAYNFHFGARVETVLLLADPEVPHATDRLIGLMLRDEIARSDTWHLFLPNSVQGTSVNRQLWLPIELHERIVTHKLRQATHSRWLPWLNGNRPAISASRC